MTTKHKRGVSPTARPILTRYILGNNAGGIVTFRSYISESAY